MDRLYAANPAASAVTRTVEVPLATTVPGGAGPARQRRWRRDPHPASRPNDRTMTEHLREIELRETEPRAIERRDIEQVVDDELQALATAVTVIVPAYNEAAHVAEQVPSADRIMRRAGGTYEIIVVDDGSTDGTAEAANAAGRARVVRRAQNRGYCAALKLGVSLARYDWILITDADGTYPVESIPTLLAQAETNSMVVG